VAFARSFFQTLVTQLVTSALAVVSGIFITRLLGPEGKGMYALLQADINLLVLVLGVSLPAAIVFYVANGRLALGRLLTITLGAHALGTVAAAAIVVGLRSTRMRDVFLPPSTASWWHEIYIAAAFLLVSLCATISAIFQGRRAFRLVNVVSLIVAGVGVVVYGSLYVWRVKGPHPPIDRVLAASLALYGMTATLWMALYAWRVGVWPDRVRDLRRDVQDLWGYLTITHVASLIQFLNYQLDVWLVGYFWNETELGFYATAVGTAQLLWLIAQPIASVLFPYISSGDESESRAAFELGSRVCFSLTLLLSLVMVALAELLIPAVYGQAFSPSVASLRILLPGVLVGSVTKVFAAFIAARGGVRYNLIGSVVGVAFTLVLDLMLIPRWGGRGAAVATVVSYLAIWLVCAWTVVRVFRVPIRRAFLITPADVRTLIDRLATGRALLR